MYNLEAEAVCIIWKPEAMAMAGVSEKGEEGGKGGKCVCVCVCVCVCACMCVFVGR